MIRFPQSLRGLTIAFLAFFLSVTALAGFGTFFATASLVSRLVDKRIEAESIALAPENVKIDRVALALRITQMARQRETADLGLLLTDLQGRAIAGNVHLSRALPLGFSSLGRQDKILGLSAGRVLVREVDGMRLAVFAETEPVDDYFTARKRIYVAGFGAIIIVMLAGLLLFRRLIAARIEAMRRTAASIMDGDLSRRVALIGDGGEFDGQAEAFNQMLDRMGQLMEEIRNVSNDISHDLRTPLARLRNALALMEQQAEAAPLRERLEDATRQADELLAMFNALLRIAEIESGRRRAGFRMLDLSALAAELVEMIAPLAREQGQQIILRSSEPAQINGDRQLLAQLLLNLLENAVRHTPAGTTISISVEPGPSAISVIIADNGPGIPAEARALALRRFGRLDRSRQRTGHGLGLPLADAIARLHRGALLLEDAAPGLRIRLSLPR